jgi:hypothetical protein
MGDGFHQTHASVGMRDGRVYTLPTMVGSVLHMKRCAFVVAAFLGVACSNSTPPGVVPLVVYVIDAVSGAPLCNATVTANGVPMTLGGETPACYFTPGSTLSVGEAVSITVADPPKYTSATETTVIPSTGKTVTVQLAPIDVDGGSDASTDASSDGATDAEPDGPSDAETDASDASSD